MKALRRSIKGEKDTHKHSHSSIQPKSATAIIPPKKVIKALYDYTHVPDPTKSQEENSKFLSFYKGDFFHVIGRENEEDWYEACHPGPDGVRGLVPVSYFEVFGKTGRASTGSSASQQGTPSSSGDSYINAGPINASGLSAPKPQHGRAGSISRGAMVYGIVQYDFHAERPDELDAKAGEAIIVIAKSNSEWFVAKPIGRLGGPGLIPVSFIEIKDMATGKTVADPHQAVQAAGVPPVEEWKKLAADYKNSSINLGKFEIAGNVNNSQTQLTQDMGAMSINGQQDRPNVYGNGQAQSQKQLRAPVSASVPRYCFENDKYWYIIECVLDDGTHWELSRFYQNFYDFQIALLQKFPEEAATDKGTRILPFMPGPVTYVTDAISNGRRESLNEYVKQLLALPDYISKCQLVRQLFDPREGDFELDPKALNVDYGGLSGSGSPNSSERNSNLSHSNSNQGINGNGYGGQQQPPPRSQQWSAQGQSSYTSYASNTSISSSQYQPQQQQPRYNTPPSSQPPQQSGGLGSSSAPGNSNGGGGGPSGGALKIKVWFEDECIAIRVPSDISFDALLQKIQDRLRVNEQLLIQYKDEPSGGERLMSNDDDLYTAIQRNQRLQLYVGYAWDGARR